MIELYNSGVYVVRGSHIVKDDGEAGAKLKQLGVAARVASYTLLPKHRHSIQQSQTHLPRRKLRMTTTNPTRKRSISILRLHLPTHRTKHILRII